MKPLTKTQKLFEDLIDQSGKVVICDMKAGKDHFVCDVRRIGNKVVLVINPVIAKDKKKAKGK